MPNGPSMNEHHIDSSSPVLPNYTFAPTNFREMIQRQIDHTVDRGIDAISGLSIGSVDGRFINSGFPAKVRAVSNGKGFFYHVVGRSRAGDLSVAAP
jgi:hypothetical protein